MSAVANIVLADAQATPVNHTFVPLGPDSNQAWWFEDQTAASPIGNNRISLQLVRSAPASAGQNAGDRTSRVKIGLHCPVLETTGTNDSGITPPPTVAYVPRFTAEFIMSDRSTTAQRETLRKFAYGLLNDTQLKDMVEDLINVY